MNAPNRHADYDWIKEREFSGSDVRDVSDDYALLAVQGPRAIERLGLPAAAPFTFAEATIDGVQTMVNRTGYTGEDGCELLCMAEDAVALWDAVARPRRHAVRARRARHAAPRGLLPAARQRHRAGHRRDLGRPRLGPRARQGVHRRRGLREMKAGGPRAEARRLRMEERAIPRQGMRSRAGAWSPPARIRRCSTSASAWATCRRRRLARHRVDGRRARQGAGRPDRQEADHSRGGVSGS